MKKHSSVIFIFLWLTFFSIQNELNAQWLTAGLEIGSTDLYSKNQYPYYKANILFSSKVISGYGSYSSYSDAHELSTVLLQVFQAGLLLNINYTFDFEWSVGLSLNLQGEYYINSDEDEELIASYVSWRTDDYAGLQIKTAPFRSLEDIVFYARVKMPFVGKETKKHTVALSNDIQFDLGFVFPFNLSFYISYSKHLSYAQYNDRFVGFEASSNFLFEDFYSEVKLYFQLTFGMPLGDDIDMSVTGCTLEPYVKMNVNKYCGWYFNVKMINIEDSDNFAVEPSAGIIFTL